ncbi:MAG: recombinase family protein [Firmicutes bacterium]|nr:recombinase family protein [Bacillota bacterium]
MSNVVMHTRVGTTAQSGTKNNAVIYPRYSSTGQNEQTIETQIQLCKEYAEKRGLKVIKVFDGDKAKSASKETNKRKDLHKMLAVAEGGTFQYIIVYELNRFARNRAESVLFKSQLEKYGVRVLSVCEDIRDDEGGELYEMILEWRDEKYSRDLSRRVRHGLDTSVANGTYCGGYLIYGYKKILEPIAGKVDRFIKTVAIDEEQAVIVRYVFEEYDKGVEKKDIATALNARGHRYGGKPFTGKSFDKWVVNEKYTGEFYFGERHCTNMYPPIIDKALFLRVQERLSKNKYFAGGVATARVPYYLTGKAVCEHCDTDIVSDGGTGRHGTTYHYYACKKMKKRFCDKKRNGKDELELYVVECVRDFLSDPANAELAASDTIKYYEKRTGSDNLKSVETKIANTRKEVEELADAFVKAKSDLLQATIEKKMTEIETVLDDLLTEKSKLEMERGLRMTKRDVLDFIAELLEGDPQDKEYQRKLIDKLVYKVYISDSHGGHKVVFLNLNSCNGIENDRVSLKNTKEAVFGVLLANNNGVSVQTHLPPLRQVRMCTKTFNAHLVK